MEEPLRSIRPEPPPPAAQRRLGLAAALCASILAAGVAAGPAAGVAAGASSLGARPTLRSGAVPYANTRAQERGDASTAASGAGVSRGGDPEESAANDPEELLAALDAGAGLPAPERGDLFGRLVACGPAAARLALSGFEAAGLGGRRLRSLVVREAGDASLVAPALVLLDEPDAEVRRNALAFVAQVAGTVPAGLREGALGRAVESDPDRDLRQLAWLGLGSLGAEAAVAEMLRCLDVVPVGERALGARVLAATPSAREVLCRRVQEAFAAEAGQAELPGRRLPLEVLSELLSRGYGGRLAELPAGGFAPRDRAPFALARRHHDARVRAAGEIALSSFVARSTNLGHARAADRVLASLLAEGVEPSGVWRRRALLGLRGLIDAQVAVDAGAELERVATAGDAGLELERRFDAAMISALAALVTQDPESARAALDRAAQAAAASRGGERRATFRGRGRRQPALSATDPEVFLRQSLVELVRALAWLSAGAEPDDLRVLEAARDAHTQLLRAQLASLEPGDSRGVGSKLSEILQEQAWSPDLVLFGLGPESALAGERGLDLFEKLCIALATVAPSEMPGFTPRLGVAPSLADPERDEERRDLLFRMRADWLDGGLGRGLQAESQGLLALRHPGRAALLLAEGLLAEGRPAEARALLERMRADLDAGPPLTAYYLGEREELVIDIQRSLGVVWTDLGEPERAEATLLEVLERLAALESSDRAQGRDVARVERDRADTLVSLAVNANVRLGDAAKALGYFEQAYELRQDDFMTVLLACYRARAGRAEEAREILAGAVSGPSTFYNLACTHALLGDQEAALDFLTRDFRENHASASALARQQAWARSDPDLAALRGDARFERLLELDFAGATGF